VGCAPNRALVRSDWDFRHLIQRKPRSRGRSVRVRAASWQSRTYRTAASRLCSSFRYPVLARSAHQRRRPAHPPSPWTSSPFSLRVHQALNCSATLSGWTGAETTTCTWFVRQLTAWSSQPRIRQCSMIV